MGENQSIDYQPKYPPKIAISEPTGRSILQKSSTPKPDFPKTVSFNPIFYTRQRVEHDEESQMSKKAKGLNSWETRAVMADGDTLFWHYFLQEARHGELALPSST